MNTFHKYINIHYDLLKIEVQVTIRSRQMFASTKINQSIFQKRYTIHVQAIAVTLEVNNLMDQANVQSSL